MNKQQLDHFLEAKSKGIRFLQEKKYLEALSEFEEAIRLSPHDLELLLYEALCLYHLDSMDKASNLVEQLYKIDSDKIINDLPKICCMILLKAGKIKKAEKIIKENLTNDPDDAQLLNMLGYAYEKKKKYKEAEEVYRNILIKDKENINACNSIAYILAVQKANLNEAHELVTNALKKEPKNPAYLDTAGVILAAQGKSKNAVEKFKEALSYTPNNSEILQHISKIVSQ